MKARVRVKVGMKVRVNSQIGVSGRKSRPDAARDTVVAARLQFNVNNNITY